MNREKSNMFYSKSSFVYKKIDEEQSISIDNTLHEKVISNDTKWGKKLSFADVVKSSLQKADEKKEDEKTKEDSFERLDVLV